MNKSILTVTASLAALLLVSGEASAQVYTETGDAGQTQATAQASGLTQSGTILGTLSDINDADVFSLTITNTSTISFSTVNMLTELSGGIGLDTQLFLFTSAGLPVVANDDDPSGLYVQSTIPAGNSFLATLGAGTYYIGISLSGNDPINSSGQLVFTTGNGDTTALRGPASGINPANWNTFDSANLNGPSGDYEIDITSVPEPSTVALYAFGALALLLISAKRKANRIEA
jgi:hypothetical protein